MWPCWAEALSKPFFFPVFQPVLWSVPVWLQWGHLNHSSDARFSLFILLFSSSSCWGGGGNYSCGTQLLTGRKHSTPVRGQKERCVYGRHWDGEKKVWKQQSNSLGSSFLVITNRSIISTTLSDLITCLWEEHRQNPGSSCKTKQIFQQLWLIRTKKFKLKVRDIQCPPLPTPRQGAWPAPTLH